MKKSDFYYNLPQEFIAQTPVEPRDSSRMMVVDKKSGKIEHRHFYDVLDYINENDCIIINDTRVLPARIYGVKKDTGAVVEFLLLSQKANDVWECVTGPGRRAKPGTVFDFNGLMSAEVVSVLDGGNRLVRFIYEGNFYNILDQIGEMPLPHYITEKLEDKERYQTVYSANLGSAAAPTAGLHFTPELLAKIEEKGIKIGKVTLHVGLGTFRPVKEENIENHLMHSEHYHLPAETAELINSTHEKGGRVFAVGTTTCRTLESVATKHGKIIEDDDWTSIFIYPGYKFKCIDSLITNFHLPESTLIMLVSAFAGYENTMNAYKIAVEEKYRFFSFGDSSMFTDLI